MDIAEVEVTMGVVTTMVVDITPITRVVDTTRITKVTDNSRTNHHLSSRDRRAKWIQWWQGHLQG